MKRKLSLVLCIAMLICTFASCGSSNGGNATGGSKIEYDSVVPQDVTFEGETFSILSREDNAYAAPYQYEVVADESSSDVVNQAVYERNMAVEERFGIKIVNQPIPGHWEANEDFTNTFRNSILAGGGAWDMILGQQGFMADLGLTELYCNFYDIPYIQDNLNADYYFPDLVNELSLNNKLFFLVGDYCLTFWDCLYVTFFNKQLAENYQVEDLYQLVRDGKWTLDKMMDISKGMYADLNGDSWPWEEDQFGMIIDINNTPAAIYSWFDNQPTTKKSDGTVEITIDQAKMVSMLEKFIAFKNTDDVFACYTSASLPKDQIPLDGMFTENRALFYPEILLKAKSLRSMETDFGILPFPKWDENQPGYYTEAQNSYSCINIPIDCTNKAKAGAVIDVLSAISYSTVIPAYYDVSLKNKYSRDDESGEMLDIIRDGIKFNFGTFYYDIGINKAFVVLIPQDNSNYVSYFASNRKGYERNLKKILATYDDEPTK